MYNWWNEFIEKLHKRVTWKKVWKKACKEKKSFVRKKCNAKKKCFVKKKVL